MGNSDEQSADLAHADIGLVAALPIELSPLVDRLTRSRKYQQSRFLIRGGRYDGIRVVVIETGMGYARAREATEILLKEHTPDWVLSCGFSGALRDGVELGDIVVAKSICDTHGNNLTVDMQMPEQPRLHVGRLLVTDELVRHVSDKRKLGEQFDALAVDMESLAVAQVCQERAKRFLAIRAISDDLSEDLPPEILSIVGDTGTVRFGAALGAIWKRPSSLKEMWHLRENANRASNRLADFLDGVLHQLVPGHGEK